MWIKNIFNKNIFKLSVWVWLITLVGSSGAYAASLPGIASSGFPNFTFGSLSGGVFLVEVESKPGQMRAKGKGDFTVNISPTTSVSGQKGEFLFDAEFDNSGSLIAGPKSNLEIQGVIPAFGIQGSPTLVTADLTSFAFGTDPSLPGFTLLGFNTTNIWCAPALGFDCTPNESVYFILDPAGPAFPGVASGASDWMSEAITITTVPVPAAAWLFGSGVVGLAGLGRRRRSAAV